MRQALKWLGIALGLLLALQLWYLGHVLWWWQFNPASTAFMEAGLARLQEKQPDAELRYRWVDYKNISIHLKRAVIAAEDAKFIAHEGFDWEGIETALEKNLKKGKVVAGGSTISQQLAKNLFLSASRNPLRKAQEAVITVMIEALWSKRRILEVYLNVIEWGNGIYGAEAAARRYFKTSAASLGPDQAATLAAMIPNPRYYETHRSARGLLKRKAIIAARMWQVYVPK
ncbi:monofunctional biosynthetic peptidoglycan transglycosylase [Sulfuritortus calidifontis]|uniref:Biosynthetic peptidoglycan transglycosylase n=1 Tax=Sulfuritortus calidifontis TaxID=1914471 RepID=A0A4R3JUF4_9PROT|nr:monofunctional biosynthetic peptidoglycan transglycosylase [Sulfuritortus calidifontis]TCS71318.1 monofunctional biosynthetic peptidoglycan transglycosylase [Sulfuritortus calidifontis]